MFVLDSSGSITWQDPANWQRMLAFVAAVTAQFSISRDLTHVGMVLFSTTAKVEFGLDQYQTLSAVNRTIYDVKHIGGDTNIAAGLRTMRNEVFTRQGDRPNAKNIGIVITDGVANVEAEQVEREARMAREDQDVELFAIGITSAIEEFELNLIASDPRDDHKFLSPDFRALQDILAEVKLRACEVAPTIGPTVTPRPTTPSTSRRTPRPTYTTPRPYTPRPYTPRPTTPRPVVIRGELHAVHIKR